MLTDYLYCIHMHCIKISADSIVYYLCKIKYLHFEMSVIESPLDLKYMRPRA